MPIIDSTTPHGWVRLVPGDVWTADSVWRFEEGGPLRGPLIAEFPRTIGLTYLSTHALGYRHETQAEAMARISATHSRTGDWVWPAEGWWPLAFGDLVANNVRATHNRPTPDQYRPWNHRGNPRWYMGGVWSAFPTISHDNFPYAVPVGFPRDGSFTDVDEFLRSPANPFRTPGVLAPPRSLSVSSGWPSGRRKSSFSTPVNLP